MEEIKTLIGICSYKGPDVHCFRWHYEFMHGLGKLQERSYWINVHGYQKGIPPVYPESSEDLRGGDPFFQFYTADEGGNSLIGQARDRICEQAVDNGFDYVLMFDDDMRFDRDIFLRLWRHQKPVIGALAFTAREPITPVLYKFESTWNPAKSQLDVDIQPVRDYGRDTLIQVDAIGTGVVLIDTKVLKKIPKPWFHGAVGCGEDIHFSFQCKRAGVGVYCDTAVKTSHRPNEPQKWHDEDYYNESQGELLWT